MSLEATYEYSPLENAWSRFASYDQNAIDLRKKFFRLRLWMLVVGVAATTLAVSYSYVEVSHDRPHVTDWRFYVWLPLMVAPVLGSVLSAAASKLSRGADWISLRGAAEALKREIYTYRCRLGAYGGGDEAARGERRPQDLLRQAASEVRRRGGRRRRRWRRWIPGYTR